MRESDAGSKSLLSRRRLLKAGGFTALVIGAAAAAVRTRGYGPPRAKLLALSVWQYAVVEQAARRVAAPDRGGDPAIPTADDAGVAIFVDAWVSRMSERVRRDLGRFLAYLEHLAPLGVGYLSRFTRLTAAEQDRVLASIETSHSDLLRAGFDGLKSLVFIGYYRDPRTWKIVGYDGPQVDRPVGGWR